MFEPSPSHVCYRLLLLESETRHNDEIADLRTQLAKTEHNERQLKAISESNHQLLLLHSIQHL
jgi:hypothetical protein